MRKAWRDQQRLAAEKDALRTEEVRLKQILEDGDNLRSYTHTYNHTYNHTNIRH